MLTLKPFTKDDWLGFSGADSDNPLVCHFTKWNYQHTLVVNDAHVEIIYCSLDGDDDPLGCWKDFDNAVFAEHVAQQLLRITNYSNQDQWLTLVHAALGMPQEY